MKMSQELPHPNETATIPSIRARLPQFDDRNRVASLVKNVYLVFAALGGYASTDGSSPAVVFRALSVAMITYLPLGFLVHGYFKRKLWRQLAEVIRGSRQPSVDDSRDLARLPFHKTVIDTFFWVSACFTMPWFLHICGGNEHTVLNVQSTMLWMTPLSILVELLLVYEANRIFEDAVMVRQALPDPFYLSVSRRWALVVGTMIYALILIIAWLYERAVSVANGAANIGELPSVIAFSATVIVVLVSPLLYFAARKQEFGLGDGPRCPSCHKSVSADLQVCPHDGTLLSFPPTEAVLSEKYEFLEQIGRGGMGTVYKARHIMLDKTVAIKVLDTKFGVSIDSSRFQREAKAATLFDSPNIVKVYDFGLLPDGKCYLAMEYLVGETLSEVIRAHGALPIPQWIDISKQLAAALAEVHKHRIIHRDLKPSNVILVTGSGGKTTVKLIDFGVAKVQDAPTLTGTGEVLGTPYYMSPEQYQGGPMDERADIYSLCCLLYEALVGKPPLMGETSMQTIFKHINERPLPPSRVCDELPAAEIFDYFFNCGLAKNPNQRFADAFELLLVLEEIEAATVNKKVEAPDNKKLEAPRDSKFTSS